MKVHQIYLVWSLPDKCVAPNAASPSSHKLPSIITHSCQILLAKRNFLTSTLPQWLRFLLLSPPLTRFLSVNYPQKSCCISCHTVEAYAQMQPASQSSQAEPHRASLKLLNALLIPALPWLQLVDPAFSKTMNGLWSLWLLLHARPSSESPPCVCLEMQKSSWMPHRISF